MVKTKAPGTLDASGAFSCLSAVPQEDRPAAQFLPTIAPRPPADRPRRDNTEKGISAQNLPSAAIIGHGFTPNMPRFAKNMAIFAANLGIFVANLGIFAANLGMFAANLGMFAANLSMFVANLGMFMANLGMFAAKLGKSLAELGMLTADLSRFESVIGTTATAHSQSATAPGTGWFLL